MNFLSEKETKAEDLHFGEGLVPEDFLDSPADSFDLAPDPQCLDSQVANAKLGLTQVTYFEKRQTVPP